MRSLRFLWMFVSSALLLTSFGCAARAWRHGYVLSFSPDGFVLRERFYPHTEVHILPSTRFQCGKQTLRFSDLQPYEVVTVEGGYRHDGSIDATKIAVHRKRSACAADATQATSGKGKETAPAHWDLKYKSGSALLNREQWLRGVFVTGGAAKPQANPIVAISRNQVRTIYFDPKAEKDSELLQRMPRSGCGYAKYRMPHDGSVPGPEVFLAWGISPGPVSRVAAHFDARYLVRLAWSDNVVEKEVELSVSNCEYASFLANLRWFTGQRWQDIGHEFPR